MGLGMSQGVNWPTFKRLVKSIKIIAITQTERYEFDAPVDQFWQVPISAIQVNLPDLPENLPADKLR